MKLSVVIVSYNVRYYLEQCLASVMKATEGMDCEVIVVDNDSTDGTLDYLKQRIPEDVIFIESNHNLGFARANNIAIRQSQGEYVLLLNPDTFVGEQSIRQVVDFMDAHPKAGGAGVMMHNSDGTLAMESRRGLPTPCVSLQKMLGFSERYYMKHLSWDEPGRIDVMSGAFCMLRRKALDEVGLLDEDFFMYGEDIDLSYRITQGGYENWYVPAPIVHYKGESTQKSSYRYVHVFYQAMLIFFRKHYGHLSFLVTAPIKAAIYLRALIALVMMLYWRMRQSLGFIDEVDQQTRFVFVGSPEMLDQCRELARRKGLLAEFHGSVPSLADVNNYIIVYDVVRFGFGNVIKMAAQQQHGLCLIGTYSTQTRILITPKEIIK